MTPFDYLNFYSGKKTSTLEQKIPEPVVQKTELTSPDQGLSFAAAKTKLEQLTNSPEQIDLVNKFIVDNPTMFDAETVSTAKTEISTPRNVSLVSYADSPVASGMMNIQSPEAIAAGSKVGLQNAQFDIAKQILSSYGITGFIEALDKIRSDYPDADSATILQLFQYDPSYNEAFLKRFSANKTRMAAGLPMINAADYLQMEQGYKKLFTSYNLSQFANQSMYDSLITNDIDVPEATDRVVLAYDRLLSDKNTLDAFKKFFPALTNEDIVGAMLDPKNQVPALKRKVTAAEVGGQAAKQALVSSYAEQIAPAGTSGYSNVTRGTIGAEAAVAAGATKATSAADYQQIAYDLPIMEKLSSIYAYGLDQYGQQQAEQAQIQGLASAARKKQALIAKEESTWSGKAGTFKSSLGGGRSNVI